MGIGKGVLYVGGGLLALTLLVGVAGPVMSVLTAPGRVITKTMGTDNIINNYEMFFDLNTSYQQRIGDIAGHTAAVASATGDEKNRLQVELLGMKNTCRDLVAKYNAASQKENRAVFKANNLPAELDMTTCN